MERFMKICRERHSVRAFRDQPLKEETVQQILEAVRTAPSAGNLQAYEVLLVKEKVARTQLSAATHGQEFIAQAPLVMAFIALPEISVPRYGRRGQELYCLQDATIACTFAMLAATAAGLASAWVGAFAEDVVRSVLGLGKNQVPVALLPLGYAAEEPAITPRRSVAQIAREL
jgi:nitroreductase